MTLEDIVKYAEAFEVAIHDQDQLQNKEEAMGASEYHKKKSGKFKKQHRRKPCNGCGSLSHGFLERETACPAWGKTCLNCKKGNHFASVYKQSTDSNSESADTIVARVIYENDK